MRDWDLEIYSALLNRPGLCMGTNDWNEVEKFIRAYELGSNYECDFMNLLTNQIHNKYGVAMPTRGLIEQLKLASNITGKQWEDLFIEETKLVLASESDGNNEFRVQKILRNKILISVQKMPELIDSSFWIELNQINRQIEDWHGENISTEEISLFKEIREELGSVVLINITDKIEPNEILKLKIMELKSLINRLNNS